MNRGKAKSLGVHKSKTFRLRFLLQFANHNKGLISHWMLWMLYKVTEQCIILKILLRMRIWWERKIWFRFWIPPCFSLWYCCKISKCCKMQYQSVFFTSHSLIVTPMNIFSSAKVLIGYKNFFIAARHSPAVTLGFLGTAFHQFF